METMKAFWLYDWRRNWGRHVALAALVAIWPWAMAVSQAGMERGLTWAAGVLVISLASSMVIPLLLASDAIELGRAGSPRETHHFVHTLPVDRGQWALAKLVGSLLYVGVVPALLFVAMAFGVKLLLGIPFELTPGFPCVLAAGVVWVMLWAALLPHRWVMVGIPVFVLGECLARGVTSLERLQSGVPKSASASVSDMGLLVLLAALLGAVFVRYHQRRARIWALVAAFAALGGIDAVRALVWWAIRTRL